MLAEGISGRVRSSRREKRGSRKGEGGYGMGGLLLKLFSSLIDFLFYELHYYESTHITSSCFC